MQSHSGIRVFVVDDEPVIASSMASILRLQGFLATSFTNPVEALASAWEEPPDILLSDVVMPGLSGIELALEVKALCPGCKVLLFSGQAHTVDFLQDAQKLDAGLHIIPKPIQPHKLLTIIKQSLEEN
jgi:DNA-binding NtrC family response regulator